MRFNHAVGILFIIITGFCPFAWSSDEHNASGQIKKYWDLTDIGKSLSCSRSNESDKTGGIQAVQVDEKKLYVFTKDTPGTLAWEVYRIMLPYTEYTEGGVTKRLYDGHLLIHAGEAVKSVVELRVRAGVDSEGNLSPNLGDGDFRGLNREGRVTFSECHF